MDAVLTLQEIESWVHKWVLDEYHLRNMYDDHVPAPILRYNDVKNGKTDLILPLPRESPHKKHEINELNLSTLVKDERTLRNDGIQWEHLKYNTAELSDVFKIVGKRKVDVLLDSRDIRKIWVINPITNYAITVELASGWAQVIAKTYINKPINASAWKKQVKLLKMTMKLRITPYNYIREKSKNERKKIIERAKKETKSIRKEREKTKETQRKSIDKRLEIKPKIKVNNSMQNQNLNQNNSIKMKSEEVISEENITDKSEIQEIDWNNIKPAGKRKRSIIF